MSRCNVQTYFLVIFKKTQQYACMCKYTNQDPCVHMKQGMVYTWVRVVIFMHSCMLPTLSDCERSWSFREKPLFVEEAKKQFYEAGQKA